MLASAIPPKFTIPFANSAPGGQINYPLPTASQVGITNGAASLTTGFPPLCFIPTGSGGVPPFGADFQGLLKQITQWSQWMGAGGTVPYDATFQTAISGYPAGAVVASAVTLGLFWLSNTDNNTTNPDTGGAGWQSFLSSGTTTIWTSSGTLHATLAQRRVVVRLTAPAAFTLDLPAAAPYGYTLTVVDYDGVTGVDPITVTPTSGVINGGATFLFQNSGAVIDFVKYGIDGSGHDIWGTE